MPGDGEGQGHGGIKVGARDMADRVDHHRDRQAEHDWNHRGETDPGNRSATITLPQPAKTIVKVPIASAMDFLKREGEIIRGFPLRRLF